MVAIAPETPWIIVTIVLAVAVAGLSVYVWVRRGSGGRRVRDQDRRSILSQRRPQTELYHLTRPRRSDREDPFARGTGYSPLEPRPSRQDAWR